MRNRKKLTNNTSGGTGVYLTESGRWLSLIGDGQGGMRRLGLFDDIETAKAARQNAEVEMGYHEMHGKR